MNIGLRVKSGLAACTVAVAVGAAPAQAATTLDGAFSAVMSEVQSSFPAIDVGTTFFAFQGSLVIAAVGSYAGLEFQSLSMPHPLTASVGSTAGFNGAFGNFSGTVTSARLSSVGDARSLELIAFGDFAPSGTLSGFTPTRSRVTFTYDQLFAGGVVSGRFNVVSPPPLTVPPPVPEPGTWALLIGGLGLVGYALRKRRPLLAAA